MPRYWQGGRSRCGAGGFTLVEVMVVLLLAGLVATLVTLRVEPNPNTMVDDEGARLQQVLEAGIDRARATRMPVVWQASAEEYALLAGDSGAGRSLDRHVLAAPARILGVWSEGIPQAAPYRLSLSARAPLLFTVRLGAGQGGAGHVDLTSTPLGRVGRVRRGE